jgi:hypothetical protein
VQRGKETRGTSCGPVHLFNDTAEGSLTGIQHHLFRRLSLRLPGFYRMSRTLVNGVYCFTALKTFEKQSVPLKSKTGYAMLC